MPRTLEQERGIKFEEYVADLLGGETVPGSGNKFYAKSDVRANGLIVSCKSEVNLTWNKIIKHLYEAIDMSYQSGDVPVLAVDGIDDCESFVVMRIVDLVKAFSDKIKIENGKESKGLEKRKKADIPLMLR